MGIQEIRKEFEKAQEELTGRQGTEALQELMARYREDERAGVQALLKRAEKQLNALWKERERMWEMKRFEREYGGKGPVCGTAMNREIAPNGGNFRGVCPIIGRLRRNLYVA